MSNTNTSIYVNHINTEDISDSFPDIINQVCTNLQYILVDNADIEQNKADIENTHIVITYKIEQKVKSKRRKLKNLGKYEKIKKEEEHKTCSICLNDFECGKYKRKMPNCDHEFHKKCVDRWLYKDINLSCPMCRTSQKLRIN